MSPGAVIGLTDVSAVVEADAATAAAQAEQSRNQLSMDEAAIGILRADLDGIVTYANPALHSMVGMPDGSLVGASVVDGSPEPEAKWSARCFAGSRRASRRASTSAAG